MWSFSDSSVISSVKMVDGILKVDASSNVDLSESVEELLRKPVVIDFAKVVLSFRIHFRWIAAEKSWMISSTRWRWPVILSWLRFNV